MTSGCCECSELSEEAKLELKLGIFEGIRSQRESKTIEREETEEEQMRKVIILVLISAVSGSKYFRESRSGPIVYSI